MNDLAFEAPTITGPICLKWMWSSKGIWTAIQRQTWNKPLVYCKNPILNLEPEQPKHRNS